ncbi:MAG: 30S ribosomal protein S8 [Coxiella sp. RIFCSPHIGHO2_12_FULL_44_14]|nr:MAG: 30S ribosomal protein S8 [Coxiella sp. RIFCSPHIGHO2_12_FULL_44_14]
MSMQDPLADMLTRVRNAQAVAKKEVSLPPSRLKWSVATVLKNEGFIENVEEVGESTSLRLVITLKYYEGRPVISYVRRVSRPGLRIYRRKDDLPTVKNGLGIAVISTSKGVMSDREARRRGEGGEVLCYVS